MSTPIEISNAFIHEITRRSADSAAWAAALPETVATLCTQWKLHIDGTPSYGKTSIVIPVIGNRSKSALKLVSPVVDMSGEARALRLFAGPAMVKLLDSSESDRAILLERLQPISLMESESPDNAISIAGEIAAILGSVTAPSDVKTFASDSSGWLIGIRQQHEAAIANGTNFTHEQFSLAREVIDSMQYMETSTMTHGDLSMENILCTESDNWVAIDPLLLCGPVENEAHTVVRSFLPYILESANPSALLDDLTRRFCDSAAADFDRARRISFARYVASYYCESQNIGDSGNAHRLREATLMTYEAIQNS